MLKLKLLTLKRCFPYLPEVLLLQVFDEIERYYREGRKEKLESLFILAIKAQMKRKTMEDYLINVLFDVICNRKDNFLTDICKMKITREEKPSKLQESIQRIWNYFFYGEHFPWASFQNQFPEPLPLFKGPTLSNVPDVMEAMFDDMFPCGKGKIHILILKKSFQISATDHIKCNLMVDAPHKDGIKYGAYWPFRFALLAFRKKFNTIIIELGCESVQEMMSFKGLYIGKQKRHKADMAEAMGAFLKKFERKRVPQGWRSRSSDDVSYTLQKSFMHGNTYEADFRKVHRWSKTHYNWGYIVWPESSRYLLNTCIFLL